MIYLYNSLTKQKAPFTPIDPKHPKMYVCGPTVYGPAHLGNTRPVIVFDVLYRFLKHTFPHVTYVRNITDIDDKIYKAALKKDISIASLTQKTTEQFHSVTKALNALFPSVEPRATDHIPHMITMIQHLLHKDHAYITDDHHVMFDTSSHSHYGQLSRRNIDKQHEGVRIQNTQSKRHPHDFVLWKPSHDPVPGWDSPFGYGRPGWHIECSAMSHEYLGTPFDIHGGGIDLVFPHHENEIAQSCCALNTATMAHVWMHNGHLTVNGEKMSKSLGNVLLAEDLLKDFNGDVIRLMLLKTHYRQPLDWREDTLNEAKRLVERVYDYMENIEENTFNITEYDADIMSALCDDLNTPLALSRFMEKAKKAFKDSNTYTLSILVATMQNLVGLFLQKDISHKEFSQKKQSMTPCPLSDEAIDKKIHDRHEAKRQKDFKKADMIRDELASQGIILIDTKDGTRWTVD
jgi:cysteinyl-tRNA synthetase